MFAEATPFEVHAGMVAALFALGLGLGVLTGLFGVGGGFAMVPIMNVLLGIPYSLAKGSGLACFVGASASGVMRHWRLGNVATKTMLIIAGGSMGGAMLGGMLNEYIEATVCGGDPHRFEMIMHPLYILLLIVVGVLVWRGPRQAPDGMTPLQRLPIGPRVAIRLADQDGVSLPGLVYLGVGIGVVTGLLGVGGGVLMMPLLLLVVGLETKHAVGTSLGVVLFASTAGTVSYALEDQVDLRITMAVLVGSTLGIQLGAWLCSVLHASRIRKYFVLLLAAVIVMLTVDLVRQLSTQG